MDDMDKIHIKLELCKDKGSGLTIITHFNPDAPNFFKEGEDYYWMPTEKERALLTEAFYLISTDENGDPEEKKVLKFLNKKNSQEKSDNKKEESTELPPLEKTTITESDRQSIDEALERYKESEGSLSGEDKEKIIEKILSQKKK